MMNFGVNYGYMMLGYHFGPNYGVLDVYLNRNELGSLWSCMIYVSLWVKCDHLDKIKWIMMLNLSLD